MYFYTKFSSSSYLVEMLITRFFELRGGYVDILLIDVDKMGFIDKVSKKKELLTLH